MLSCYDGIDLFTHTFTGQFAFKHQLVQDRTDVLGEGLGFDSWVYLYLGSIYNMLTTHFYVFILDNTSNVVSLRTPD